MTGQREVVQLIWKFIESIRHILGQFRVIVYVIVRQNMKNTNPEDLWQRIRL